MVKRYFDAKETILDNGLKIVTVKKDTQLMAIHAGIKIGSINEERDEKGISHFVEHMMFKGTKTRSNNALNDELEELGGDYNAYTDFLGTVYSISALSEELEHALEILSDMLMRSSFSQKEINKERGVILAEIKTTNDDIEDYSIRKVNETAFENNPLKYDTLGEERTVKSFKKEDLIKHYNKYYVPNNCCISIVSPYEHEEMVQFVKKYFSPWQRKEFTKKNGIIESNIPSIKRTFKKEIEQSTIVFLYTFYGLEKEEELALRILNHKLGYSSNSILFRELRENKGLAYDVYTHLDTSRNIKTLYIYAGVAEEDVEETIEAINSSLDKVINEEVIFDDNTLILMKKVFKTALASTLEDSCDLGEYVLTQSMEDEDINEFIRDMENIEIMKSSELYDIARKVLKNPTIHILESEKSEY